MIATLDTWALPLIIGAYYVVAGFLTMDGYFKDLVGHHGHRNHNNLHRLIWQVHTGSHIHPMRTYGDERRLRRTANSSNRATPEGSIVYWSRRNRGQRALANNLAVIATLTTGYGLATHARMTVEAMTAGLIVFLAAMAALATVRARSRLAARPAHNLVTRPVAKALGIKVAEHKFVTAGVAVLDKPKLDGGVPIPVLANLLADILGCSTAETATKITVSSNQGSLALPNHFAALGRQRDTIEEIISAQSSVSLGFAWHTTSVPRHLTWQPVVTALPRVARFRDHLAAIEKLPPGEFGIGLDAGLTMYVSSHNGDKPWHLRSAGSGTGKSTGFQVKLAQICHKDPRAEAYCFDTKQVSFQEMHGIPGVHFYDDPVNAMEGIYKGFYELEGEMRNRYTAVRKRQARPEEFDDIWVLVDEGNDLAGSLKNYYTRYVKGSGDPVQPLVWIEAIAPLINLGRQVGVRGEFMFQNMTDNVLGGVSLRDAFGITGMAGYKKNQWSRIVGTSPIPECKNGPGKVCMVDGPNQTWVQGFYDEWEFLREYAMVGRR